MRHDATPSTIPLQKIKQKNINPAPHHSEIKMKIVILSCSLDPKSKSQKIGQLAQQKLEALGATTQIIDLRQYDLPLCDASSCYSHPQVHQIAKILKDADAIIITAAIYNYNLNAAAKNIIELTGKATWENKVVAFACAAGGMGSYMSVMSFASTLVLDFHCLIVPQILYAQSSQFDPGNSLTDPGAIQRLDKMCHTTLKLTQADLS